MKFNLTEGLLTVFLTGRISSANAGEVETELNAILSSNAHTALVFDLDELEYISSAGLRVVLRTRKAEPTLKLVNASSEVYEIFEMTGFTDMIPVEKAYRRLSVEGCEVIGQGANGKVYRYDPDTIIKVYFNSDALPDIHRERELARTAFVLGVPTAIPYDVVRVGDSYGSVFELLNAKSFGKLMVQEPENFDHYVDLYVELLKTVHGTTVKEGTMPDMKAVALNWASFLRDHLPQDAFEKLYALVEAVPHNDHMLHGDYHITNVMMQHGEVLLIDMDTLCVGDPVFEFASVYLAYQGYSINDHKNIENFMGITWDTGARLWRETLRKYFNTDDEAKLTEIENRAKIIGFTRMMRRTIRRNGYNTEQGRKDIESCKNELIRILPTVDSLSFADLIG